MEHHSGTQPAPSGSARTSSPPGATSATLPATPEVSLRGPFARDWRPTLVFLLTLLAGAAVVWVLWQLVGPILRTIVTFILAGVLAFILAGPVEALTPRLRGRRHLAIALVYLLVLVAVGGGLTLLAGPFVQQVMALAADLPRYGRELDQRLPELQFVLSQYGITLSPEQVKDRAAAGVQEQGGEVLKVTLALLGEAAALAVDALLALVISVYLVIDGPRLRDKLVAAVPAPHRGKLFFLEEHSTRVLGGYLRGQLILAGTIGTLAGLGCWLLGLPYALVLGVLAGLFELIPMFGPILSSVPAVLVAAFMPFPTVVWVLLYFFVLQQLENNLLVPRISGHAVGLHPLGAMFALLAGFQVAGVLGALFAVPLAGIVWVLATAAYNKAVVEPARRRLWPWRSFVRFRPPSERAAPPPVASAPPVPATPDHPRAA